MAFKDEEDQYFHELNRELIEKLRDKGKSPPKKGHLTLVHSVDEAAADSTQEDKTPRKKAA